MYEKDGMKTLPGDEAFYYKNEGGQLQDMGIMHANAFQISGKEDFIDHIFRKA